MLFSKMYNLFHYKKLARGKKETKQGNEISLPNLTSSGEISLLNLSSSGEISLLNLTSSGEISLLNLTSSGEISLLNRSSSGEISLLNLASSGASNSLFLGYMLYLISQSSHISLMCIKKIQTFLLLFCLL